MDEHFFDENKDRLCHSIAPVYDGESRMLILGSFPSVISRSSGFYYANARNRFFPLLSQLFCEPLPNTTDERISFLLRNKIALWDVVSSCRITGSDDSSICDVLPNDITPILRAAHIERIFTNGATAHRLYKSLIYPKVNLPDTALPSTSPRNASQNMSHLAQVWGSAMQFAFKDKHSL